MHAILASDLHTVTRKFVRVAAAGVNYKECVTEPRAICHLRMTLHSLRSAQGSPPELPDVRDLENISAVIGKRIVSDSKSSKFNHNNEHFPINSTGCHTAYTNS